MTPTRLVVPAAVMALAGAVLLAVVAPLSAQANDPLKGDTTITAAKSAEPSAITPKLALPSLQQQLQQRIRQLRKTSEYYRAQTWTHQDTMFARRTPTAYQERHTADLMRLSQLAVMWHRLASLTWDQMQNVPHKPDWLCIHRYEGSWQDTGAPYWGGLQMNWAFMATYGRRLLYSHGVDQSGRPVWTANHWAPLQQMWVAERAYESGRGFQPWTNTARACGLLN